MERKDIIDQLVEKGFSADEFIKTYERYMWTIESGKNEIEKAVFEQKMVDKEAIEYQLLQMEAHYLQLSMDFNVKVSEYYGMLLIANKLNAIEWDRVMYLLGEFVSKDMKLR
ncbi:TPA: hypothetical protein LA742_002249 [Clostridium botulinum]|uniref:hypothetical protein n=1 Tax=Clostridium sporogenes TaxID=1509 RepID=UPI000774C5C1|nr:hypothetical protein [Clostridium sporogenes]AUM93858.1 hypothetical protein RSJ11_01245 [Clostridium sporogenes]HBJ2613775.1 hypothetical protein [Clostridium botulinum]